MSDAPAPTPPRVVVAGDGGWGSAFARRHRRLTGLGALVVVLLLAAAAAVAVGLLGERRGDGSAVVGPCTDARTVQVLTDPTLASTLRRVAAEASGTLLSTGVCAEVEVLARGSAEAAAALAEDPAALGPDGPPDLWVPDSSVWLGRAVADPPRDDVTLTDLGSLVSSPLVVATSPEVVAAEGWAEEGPTWEQVLASGRPVAVADLASSAAGVQALVALTTSVTDAEARTEALAAAAAAVRQGAVPDAATAFAQVADGRDAAPLVPTSEQQVFEGARGSVTTPAVAVRPVGAGTSLDYPVVRLDTAERPAGLDSAAVEGVVRLLETAGREAALADGFREPLEAAPEPSAATPSSEPLVVPVPRWSDVDLLLEQLTELGRPARVLVVLDSTASMRGVTGTGATRAQVAEEAVATTLAQFGNSSAAGLWFFSTGQLQVVPLRPLDPAAAGVDQRGALQAGADQLDARLTAGGTGLFGTALAAVRAVREGYDPEAVNSVVLVTDGRQEDPGGPAPADVLAALRSEADPERPVRLLAVGISTDVDPAELRALAEATGGAAYLAEQPEDLEAVLADALRRR